ncbi:MAG TPA: alpha/beta fold hydrolase [Gaiellales bacterium]|nr:alpha/beta fold hydrolase [Gaiellales bacterium]
MPSFSRGEVGLWWAEAGAGEGFPVILHTGGAGAGSMWGSGGYAERLAEFRLLLLDHRGHGRSDRPVTVEAHRVEEYVADAQALADAAGLERYGFVGYSFGGAVGLRLAARDARMRALVALGAVYEQPGAEPDVDSPYVPPDIVMAELADAIERLEGVTLSDELRQEFLDTDAEQFSLLMRAGVADPWADLPSISIPVLLIAGTEEDPDGVQDEMAASLPSGRSVHLPGCGHVGAFLRPDDVCAAAVPMLRRVAA